MKTISNKQLTIQVSPHGAELCSIFANGKKYLWQADPAFWKRHSPVLFPIVGSVWENEYRNEGIPYTLTQPYTTSQLSGGNCLLVLTFSAGAFFNDIPASIHAILTCVR